MASTQLGEVSVSRTAGSFCIRSAFRLLQSAGQRAELRGWDVRKAGGSQSQDLGRGRSDVHVFPIVAAQKGDDLPLEAPPATLGVGRDLVAEPRGKADGPGDSEILGVC